MTSMKRNGLMRALGSMALDYLFPPHCPACRLPTHAEGNFCAACFASLQLIAEPMCACCGIPFVVNIAPGAHCPDCLANPPEFSMARSVMVYDAVSMPLVTSLKFGDQWAGIDRFSRMMQASGGQVLAGADMLIPVPLHWRRLLRRKFNQSALLAYGISRHSAVPTAPDILERVVYTKPQMRLDRAERTMNVKRAFAVPTHHHAQLRDKVIVLVDDVVTTGATANACARALKKAGAREVRVLALARTVRE